MARTERQTRIFKITRRGPLFANEFHYSLDAWHLSREAMLDARHKMQRHVSRKAEKVSMTDERGKDIEPIKAGSTPEVTPAMEYGMTNDAVKQLCKDVIIVAFHEVTVEESRAIGNIDTALEDKKVPLQRQEKGDGDVIFQDLRNKAELPHIGQDQEVTPAMEYGMTNDAVKQLCKDVIIVAFHEVTVEESRAIGNIDTALEDKKVPLQRQEKGDGDVIFQDLRNKAELPHIGQDQEVGIFTNSKKMLPERARQICIDAISKAVYQVAKENLDSVQNTIKSPITETLQTKVKTSSSEIFETVTQGQQKKLNKKEKGILKKLEREEKKKEAELRKYQEETAKKYIKMVNKKYKERNEINAKGSKQENKHRQKALKKEKKEKKREEENLRREKKKITEGSEAVEVTDKQENSTSKLAAPQDKGQQKLGLMGRLGQLFRCTRKGNSH